MAWFASRGWECHAVDLRGHGQSPNTRPLRRTRIKHYVEDLGLAVESLDRPPIIVAHSMGGLVAQRYLEAKWLPGAVLIAPVPVGGVWRATFRVMRRHPVKFLKANLTLNMKPLVEERTIAKDLLLADTTTDEEVDRIWPLLQAESYLAYLDMLFIVRPRPPLVSTPVAMVTGSRDRIFSVKEEQKTARAYGTDVAVVEGGAHALMLGPHKEQAGTVVAEALETF